MLIHIKLCMKFCVSRGEKFQKLEYTHTDYNTYKTPSALSVYIFIFMRVCVCVVIFPLIMNKWGELYTAAAALLLQLYFIPHTRAYSSYSIHRLFNITIIFPFPQDLFVTLSDPSYIKR